FAHKRGPPGRSIEGERGVFSWQMVVCGVGKLDTKLYKNRVVLPQDDTFFLAERPKGKKMPLSSKSGDFDERAYN
ncbi:MAG: hypothetical protein KDD10_29810, partial [Phaeodactylibacter sp.]|nr:hypothetical protein [Phaeodactylibacter sp.]